MNLTAAYRIKNTENSLVNLEFFLEYLFDLWKVNSVFRGNIQTACTLLLQHLVHTVHETTLTADRQNGFLIINISGLNTAALIPFKKNYQPEETKDESVKMIFLIQKISDEIVVNKTQLTLKFNICRHPEEFATEGTKERKER